jgi:hypothetical protein
MEAKATINGSQETMPALRRISRLGRATSEGAAKAGVTIEIERESSDQEKIKNRSFGQTTNIPSKH